MICPYCDEKSNFYFHCFRCLNFIFGNPAVVQAGFAKRLQVERDFSSDTARQEDIIKQYTFTD